jgi:hypothetical protein
MTNRPARITQAEIQRAIRAGNRFDQIDTVKVERYPRREDALIAEAETIRTEKPVHNIAGRIAA